jgi:tRNA dimethylallyltransferase
MLESGLLDEVAQLMAIRDAKNDAGEEVDYTKGVWQAIGYRQFEPYQTAMRSLSTADELKIKSLAIEQTQAATRRYASSQLKWIRIKLLNALIRAKGHKNLFVLDGTDLSKWQSSVVGPAIELTAKFLNGEVLPEPATVSLRAAELLSPLKEDLTHSPESWGVQVCDVCGVKAATPQLWKMHLSSRGHKIKTSKRKAQEVTALVNAESPDSVSEDEKSGKH